jgi:hypothetical protein
MRNVEFELLLVFCFALAVLDLSSSDLGATEFCLFSGCERLARFL